MKTKALYRLLSASLAALALDWLTKTWAERALDLHQPVPVAGQFFRLTLNYNTGVAFSLFANGGMWPAIASSAALCGLVIWLIRELRIGTVPPMAAWPIGLILGGGIANLVDRLADGRVTDFLDLGLGAARWPTFNMADTCIVLGVAMLVLMMLVAQRSMETNQRPSAASNDLSQEHSDG